MNWKDERNFRNIILSAVLTAILFFCLLFYSLFVMEKRYERYENAALGLIIQEYGNPDNQFINRLLSLNETGAELEGRNYFNDHGYEITRSLVMLDRMKKNVLFPCLGIFLSTCLFLFITRRELCYFYRSLQNLSIKIRAINHFSKNTDVHLPEPGIWKEITHNIKWVSDRIDWMEASRFFEKQNIKKDFENVIHQLKTPLTACCLYIEGLQQKEIDPIKSKKLQSCLTQLDKINNIIQELLSHPNRVNETSVFLYRHNHIKHTIEHAWIRLTPLALQKNITVQYDGLENIEFIYDDRWMTEAFENLLKNSIQAAYQNSVINIHLMRNPGNLKIEIRNTGELLKERDLIKIFERYYSILPKDQSGHTGIGLHMAKSIISGHHGTISAENRIDGVCIIISLPVLTGSDTYEHEI
ncbi:sensor histidine kinase [uncultured Robinsoniella sp.]|uniref:sensor histidine kinase n=1 Tax=Robinsoniella sp. TaxID=2496533 RepID=UPI00374F8B33